MRRNNSRQISFEELGDLLYEQWEQGNIEDGVRDLICAGFLPIKLLRERLRWIIERDGEKIRLTIDDEA